MRKKRSVNLGKAAVYAIVINALQIALVTGFVCYAVFSPRDISPLLKIILAAMGLVTCWGALVDIREAISARRVEEQADMLEEANRRMDSLNLTLRAQRHDFMNHLQVVYSLLEMDEKRAAVDYLDDVYQDLQRVGRALKTRVPAVNALLAAKMADCEKRGVQMELRIDSPWEGLPVEGWEICRALGNLIDNALDALKNTPQPRVTLCLGENLREFTFEVANNGPEIPEAIRESIFQEGYSTKSAGRGMGLAIVRGILTAHGGDIRLESNTDFTRFLGRLPKKIP